MLEPHPNLTESVIWGLGWIYLLLALANAGWTVRSFRKDGHCPITEKLTGQHIPVAAFWAFYSGLLAVVAVAHFTGYGNPESFLLRLPESFKAQVDRFSNPIVFFGLSISLFAGVVLLREWLVKPTVGWVLLNCGLLFLALSMTDYDFRQIVGKPDNVPIVAMLYIVSFFTWLYFKRAVDNDRRRAEGRPLFEQEDNDTVLVWPDLVYIELICMVLLIAVLVAWGVMLQAPLEEPASSVKTPNPSKAPWYFLGLQEMLVYFDPWLAGVVFPTVMVVGLMAIPYIDFNKLGNGYYTFKERKFAVLTFLFGFLPLWVATIVLGTFLRGPNWNFFGIFEFWDVHKLEVLSNRNLSQYFWEDLLGTSMPAAVDGAAALWNGAGYILVREAPGFLVLAVYFLALPPLLAATVFRKFFFRMGFVRYMVFVMLVLMMASLPLKMILRWTINLKYIVSIPEWFFNI